MDKALLVAKKDWKEIFSSKLTLASLILPFILPILMSVSLIALFAFLGPELGELTPKELEHLRAILPGASGMDEEQLSMYLIGALIAPLLFLLAPLMSSSAVAADSFAGERERKTIEPLLVAPVSEAELFVGKVLVSFLPTTALLYASFGICCVLVNAMTIDAFGYIWFPPPTAALTVCLIAPLYAFLGLCLVILASMKASTVRDASNYAGVLVLPLLIILLAQLTGVLVMGTLHVVVAAVLLALVDALVLKLAYRAFNREALITSL